MAAGSLKSRTFPESWYGDTRKQAISKAQTLALRVLDEGAVQMTGDNHEI